MDYFTYFQIGMSIALAVVFMFLISRTNEITLNQYFIGIVIVVVILNVFFTFVKNIAYAAEEDTTPSTTGKNHADILKDMTTQFELPARPGTSKASYRTYDRGGAGCPVIAL